MPKNGCNNKSLHRDNIIAQITDNIGPSARVHLIRVPICELIICGIQWSLQWWKGIPWKEETRHSEQLSVASCKQYIEYESSIWSVEINCHSYGQRTINASPKSIMKSKWKQWMWQIYTMSNHVKTAGDQLRSYSPKIPYCLIRIVWTQGSLISLKKWKNKSPRINKKIQQTYMCKAGKNDHDHQNKISPKKCSGITSNLSAATLLWISHN